MFWNAKKRLEQLKDDPSESRMFRAFMLAGAGGRCVATDGPL